MSIATESSITVRAKEGELQTIEAVVTECALLSADNADNFVRTLKLASGVKMLNRLVSDAILDDIMELQGLTLGFLTDKDREGGYKRDVVKKCVIEAMINGATVLNNEFNIISQRVYYAKNFFVRKLREFPGLTDLKLQPGVPVNMNGGALVPYVATWKLNGKPDEIRRLLTKLEDGVELDQRIPVKVNVGMGADAILGKAERKIRAAIYNRLTGSVHGIADGEIDDGVAILQGPSNAAAIENKLNDGAEGSAETIENNAPAERSEAFIKFLSQLQDCATQKECRELWKLRFGIDAEDENWTDQDRTDAESARNRRIAELGR